ncbi:hypothetical protein FEE95_16160 [Maribacter algarum]|uniref:Alpha/beta hydrolase n=2 Tax=Maribacter algarum (ex Zhang et al. 2020) TaxID=2578118 RepID=A0A5S3PUI3_9FLAO|nr:hypothetical protein FEE95_16160 [Maribacter algarum]
MALVKKKEFLILNEVTITEGSGTFLIEGGKSKKDKSIQIFYYKPKTFNSNSKVLIVIPGAGRNANAYRDTWIDEAEKQGILILSPEYQEKDYPFENYHLCGLISDLNLDRSLEFVKNSNMVKIDESKLSFKVNPKQDEWIFKDFDRIFDLVKKATKSTQNKYDLFGHSAGGQILHRLALFGQSTKVNQIISTNSGFYTLPNFDSQLPFGLKNTRIKSQDLKLAFEKRLIILVGELDNQHEVRGTLLRSETADKQGLHRLERAQYFYKQAKAFANLHQFNFNWEIEIVPEVGHDYRKMSKAASHIIYSQN